MENKQTAVGWLFEKIDEIPFQSPKASDLYMDIISLKNQAKEMEKQQIIEAHGNKQKTKSDPDSIVTYGYTFTGEMYYDKMFKKD